MKHQHIDKMKLSLAKRVLTVVDWQSIAKHYRERYLEAKRTFREMDARATKRIQDLNSIVHAKTLAMEETEDDHESQRAFTTAR